MRTCSSCASRSLVPEDVWKRRYDAINAFERLLADSGVIIASSSCTSPRRKQRSRLTDRLETPQDQWKFKVGDQKARAKWDEYMAAYEDALSRCSTDGAVVPRPRRPQVVPQPGDLAQILVDLLEELHMEWPALEPEARGSRSSERATAARSTPRPREERLEAQPDRSAFTRPRRARLGRARRRAPCRAAPDRRRGEFLAVVGQQDVLPPSSTDPLRCRGACSPRQPGGHGLQHLEPRAAADAQGHDVDVRAAKVGQDVRHIAGHAHAAGRAPSGGQRAGAGSLPTT